MNQDTTKILSEQFSTLLDQLWITGLECCVNSVRGFDMNLLEQLLKLRNQLKHNRSQSNITSTS